MSKGFLTRLFCMHDWKMVFDEDSEAMSYSELPLAHPVLIFKCAKCGKIRAAKEVKVKSDE